MKVLCVYHYIDRLGEAHDDGMMIDVSTSRDILKEFNRRMTFDIVVPRPVKWELLTYLPECLTATFVDYLN